MKILSGKNKSIEIKGAKMHNLKNIDLSIPKKKIIVITGVSGSGKSSLAFDTIYAEGQRKYVESLSSYARQFLERIEKPKVDKICGLSPAIALEQKISSSNPRSTVGTKTEISQPSISIRPCMISCAPSMAGTALGLTKLATSIPGKFALIK